jgi:hypothetical protein
MEGSCDTDSHSADSSGSSRSSHVVTAMKLIAASALFYSAGTSFAETYHQLTTHGAASSSSSISASSIVSLDPVDLGMSAPSNHVYANTRGRDSLLHRGRRLSDYASSSKKNPPSYMKGLMEDLKARKKLMEETPPEEVKYWFEYTGPLQVRSTRLIVVIDHFLSRGTMHVGKGRWV